MTVQAAEAATYAAPVTSLPRPGLPGRAEVSVRPARPADAEAIARVQVITWRTAYRALLPAAVLDEWDEPAAVQAWRTAVTAPPTPGHGLLVALDGDVVTGYAAYGPAELATGELPLPGGGTDEVTALLVEPRWGRRGHGSRLLAAVADLAAAAGVVRLQMWLPEEDPATSRFLDGAGWAPAGWVRTLDTGTSTIRQLRWHTLLSDTESDEIDRGSPQ
jgi:GNAT superfamily N-acetyltransferase